MSRRTRPRNGKINHLCRKNKSPHNSHDRNLPRILLQPDLSDRISHSRPGTGIHRSCHHRRNQRIRHVHNRFLLYLPLTPTIILDTFPFVHPYLLFPAEINWGFYDCAAARIPQLANQHLLPFKSEAIFPDFVYRNPFLFQRIGITLILNLLQGCSHGIL